MTKTEGELTFVVAGAPPAALAVAAERVRAILPAAEFRGEALDLAAFWPNDANDDAAHVLVLGQGVGELGISVRGHLRMLTLEPSAVLPLPAVLRQSSGLSHLIAPRGVPLMFVLDLARLERAKTLRGPAEARAAATET
jgi:hypothetical protein